MNLLLLFACAPASKPAATHDTAAATDTAAADSDSAVETATDTPTDTVDTSPTDTADTVDTDTAPPHEGPFHPELTSYPRIVALPGDKDTILARIAGTTGDANAIALWQSLYSGIQSSCAAPASVPASDPIDLGAMWSQAAIARDCAFLAWLNGDAAAGEKAASILGTQPTDVTKIDDPTNEVHISTALGLEVEAWDLLAGADVGVDLDAARAPILALTRSFWQQYVVDLPYYFILWENNHNLKFAAAVGMAGIVFNTEDEAWTWASYAQTELPFLYEGLEAADGGYGEGPYYQMYGAMQTLPYLRAWHRLLGDTGEEFDVTCLTRLPGTCTDGTREAVGDLWDNDVIRAGIAWNVAMRMPDGTRPPVDDGVPVGFPTGIVSEMDPLYGWDWSSQADPFVTWAGSNAAELLSAYDGRSTAPTSSPCEVLPDSGSGLFRSGFSADDTWALLLAEPYGPMVTSGHEHPDGGTLELYARGQYLVIDSGYAGWTERDATLDYADHSGILVDGDGPPDGSAGDLAVSWSDDADCDATASLAWDAVSWDRRVTLEDDALVVRDDVEEAGASAIQWRMQLLDGDGRGTLELYDWGGILRRDGVSLTLAVTAPEGLTVSSEDGTDALTYGTLLTHDVLTATVSGSDTAGFLSVLKIGDEDATPSVSVGASTITIDGETWTR